MECAPSGQEQQGNDPETIMVSALCRAELLQYFHRVRAALSPEGGMFVADLLGGHSAEAPVKLHRQNAVTELHYTWEQGTFNPITRHINGYITLKCPQTKRVRLLPVG
jgi:hypothetical protein